MDLHLVLGGRGRLTASLYTQLRGAMLDGRLRLGDTLPATRELARQLGVARITVASAYERLTSEGFLVGRVGDGTYVCYERPGQSRRASTGMRALEPRPPWQKLVAQSARTARDKPLYDFGVGVPDETLFPWKTWRRLLARQWTARGHGPRSTADPRGAPRLRAAIAHHVGRSRAVYASDDNILVTSGAQQALDLIFRVLLEPGAQVAVEDPGYPPVRRMLQTYGARVVPVRVDAEGFEVASLPPSVRAVYVTPSHQFPLGTAMSLERRTALLEWARRHRALIIEDDYDSEFRYDGRPLDPLHSLDDSGQVIYVGTFSKVLLPELRLGYLIAPAPLVEVLGEARMLADGGGARDVQHALAELMEEGLLARHARKVGRVYRERRERLLEALARHAASWLAPLPAFAGLHICARYRDERTDEAAVLRRAAKRGVHVQSLRDYCYQAPRSGLVLGYGALPERKVEEGVKRLAAALKAAAGDQRWRSRH